uniref:PDZ domain containing ring finger 4 n=1 Tax=Neogobius melanostomus TaxID=47308 RepID=A0A8C6SRI6_9GOBI
IKTCGCILLKADEKFVNGRDFSKGDHEGAAVEALRRDPIVVQVLRRTPSRSAVSLSRTGSPQDMCVVDRCTQTDITFEHIMALAKLRPATPPVPDICPFLLSDSTQTADGDRTEEYVYEEVVLCRQNNQEKLGLTLCYRTDDEEDLAIYVSQVEPHSLAAKDGRIKEGDRIVQINGCEVQDREKAVALLSCEDSRNVILLVTRPELVCYIGKGSLKYSVYSQLQHEEGMTTDTATCSSNNQDSGFGRGTDKRWRAEHPPSRTPKTQDNSSSPMLGLENRFQQLLELKCQIRNGVECGVYSIRHNGGNSGESEGGVEHELRMLNEELRSIELECQSIMQAHQLRQTSQPTQTASPSRSPKDGLSRHRRLADIHEHPEKSDSERKKDSSSAYNTAESARSTPIGRERSPEHSLQRHVSLTNQKNLSSSTSSSPISVPKLHGTPSRNDERSEKKGRRERRGLPYPSGYQTSPYHCQGGSRQLQLHAALATALIPGILPEPAESAEPVQRSGAPRGRSGEPRLEWKVKVRADGTRYVARRPARDRILRERALRIREERSGGMTTDDDAISELKMGRYWSKEERKQHLARAREQRKRREYMQKSRLECLREGPGSSAEGRNQVNILELSHKKMLKKRNKKILDNWMTIQELMSHGARVQQDDSKVHNAFLSVTTV